MSREILDCLKRERDICVKNVIHSQNTAFMFTPALRWLKTVSSTIQDVDFDGSLVPLFINKCYNNGIKKLPNHRRTRKYHFRDTIGYHSSTIIFENLRWLWTPYTELFCTLPKVTSYPAYQNSLVKKFTMPFLKYKKLRLHDVAGYSVAMVTFSGMKMITTC